MKIKDENGKIIIYLYNGEINLANEELLIKDIKLIFLKLIKYYHYELSGMIHVKIYENKNYGYILVVEALKEYEYNDYLDIKVEIIFGAKMYYVFDDYNTLFDSINYLYKDGCFYININDIKNIYNVIEYGRIIYDEKDIFFLESVN